MDNEIITDFRVRLMAQIRRLMAQNRRLMGAISWGKCKVIMYIKYIGVCFHSLCSFKHTIKGLRSAFEGLACPLSEYIKERGKQLVLRRVITDFVNRSPFVPCEFSSLREKISLPP